MVDFFIARARSHPQVVGYWVGAVSSDARTEDLLIHGCRFRNTYADGVNLCNGASNSRIEQSHFRNTGDDAIASWAPRSSGGNNTNNVFRFNTVQLPWRANCYAVYGGRGNAIEDSLCVDTVTDPGVKLAQAFDSWPFRGTTSVQRTTLLRNGGQDHWGQLNGALQLAATQSAMKGFLVRDVAIHNASYSGIEIAGSYSHLPPNDLREVLVQRVQVVGSATYGVAISAQVTGEATFDNVEIMESSHGCIDKN